MIAIVAVLVLGVVMCARRLNFDDPWGSGLHVWSRLASGDDQTWAEAMVAESATIADARERRRFARGCVRAAICSPGRGDSTSTQMRLVIFAGVCIAGVLAGFAVVHYPEVRGGGWVAVLVVFVAALVVFACLGVVGARVGSVGARRAGVIAALPAIGFSIAGALRPGVVPFGSIATLAVVLPSLAGGLIARRSGRRSDGVVAAVWCALLAGLLTFSTYALVTYLTRGSASTPALVTAFHQSRFHDFRTYLVSDSLDGAIALLLFVPVVGGMLGLGSVAIVSDTLASSQVSQRAL